MTHKYTISHTKFWLSKNIDEKTPFVDIGIESINGVSWHYNTTVFCFFLKSFVYLKFF